MDDFTYTLSPLDRLMLFALIPREGSFITIKCARELRERLAFTEDEVKAWNYREEDGKHLWENFEKDEDGKPDTTRPMKQDADIYLGETMFYEITKMLKDKDKNGTLTENEIGLFEKLVENRKIPATNGKAHVSRAEREKAKV